MAEPLPPTPHEVWALQRRLAAREAITRYGYYEAWRNFLGRGLLGLADEVARLHAERP